MLAIFALSITAAPVELAKPVDFVWFGRTW